MKRIISGLIFFLVSIFANAQNGLEGIIVEKYYVSNSADSAGSIGLLPAGSVTYRIYVDMLPGYKFQAAYGVNGHPLVLNTTTAFFNNEDRGAITPTYSKVQARGNSVMLDSWLSVGAACSGNFGILKSEDDVALGGATVINSNVPPILQNNDASAGIPLTTQDGIYLGTTQAVTFVGIPAADLDVFDAVSNVGNSFTTSNGSWASLNGSTGPVASTNKVLIAQRTTKGVFHFELNIQIGTPTGGVENYVASNPTGTEITLPSLTGTFGGSNTPPTVSITSPSNNSNFLTGASVTINATAADVNGSVSSVEFLVDGVSVGTDNSSPYSGTYTAAVGTHTITARATDNQGAQTTSAPITIIVGNNVPPVVSITAPASGAVVSAPSVVTITATATDADGIAQVQFYVNGGLVGTDNSSPYSVNWTSVIGTANITAVATDLLGAQSTSSIVTITVADPNIPYKIIGSTNPCVSSSFCLPVNAIDTVDNVIGYDIVLNYNKNKVAPTGVITVGNALINPTYVDVLYSIDSVNGKLNISLFFNGSAPSNSEFQGMGNLFCAEFNKTAGFNSNDSSDFSISSLLESYFNGVSQKNVDPGKYISFRDSSFRASLKFWKNGTPMPYNPSNPASNLITNIYGNNSSCTAQSVTAIQPDVNGQFSYDIINGTDITISRDILGTTSVQPVVNGFDALLTRRALIQDPTYIPTVYEMLSMDVNLDGRLSAGDVSQINQRAVLMIPEFKQAWNYNSGGTSNGQPSKDWLFIDSATVSAGAAYHISTTFPSNDGVGYSKDRIPTISFCQPVPVTNPATCPQFSNTSYVGVLIGDINGNFDSVGSSGVFRLSENNKLKFEVSQALYKDGVVEIPLYGESDMNVNAVDFALTIDDYKLIPDGVREISGSIQSLMKYNEADKTVRFTSNCFEKYNLSLPVIYLRFKLQSGDFNSDMLKDAEGFINGERVRVQSDDKGKMDNPSGFSVVYPNPANSILHVVVTAESFIKIYDAEGRVVSERRAEGSSDEAINISEFQNGVYFVKIIGNNSTEVKRVVVSK